MKQALILGNIITMDEKRSFAKAALVKNGVFAYIGSAEEAKRLTSRGTQVLDYGDSPPSNSSRRRTSYRCSTTTA